MRTDPAYGLMVAWRLTAFGAVAVESRSGKALPNPDFDHLRHFRQFYSTAVFVFMFCWIVSPEEREKGERQTSTEWVHT